MLGISERATFNYIARRAARPPMLPVFELVSYSLILRIAYLIFLCPYSLVGDEAHYWEWSQRLDWSYYTKGPGVAWVIALSTTLFGDVEWAIRLPSAIAGAVLTLSGAALAYDISARNRDAAFLAAIALTLTPAFFAASQLMTPDIFYCAAWLLSVWLIFQAIQPDASTQGRIIAWTSAGLALGVGVLFKYTALLLLPGVCLCLVVQRRHLKRDWTLTVGTACFLMGIAVASSPIVLWNARNGWPTVAHQLGRVHLQGGDESVQWNWSPLWLPEFVGAQLALLGLVGAVLIAIAVRRAWFDGSREARDPRRDIGVALLISSATPMLAFYVALSALKRAQGNWAVAAYTTLLVLVGMMLSDERSSRAIRGIWHWYIGVGVVVGTIFLFGPVLLRAEAVSRITPLRRLEHRLSAPVEHAATVNALREGLVASYGNDPLIITNSYQQASLLAFYLPGRPTRTFSARHFLGGRRTAYDFFPDTDLGDRTLHGRNAILLGAGTNDWRAALSFDRIERSEGTISANIGYGYRGPVAVTGKGRVP